MAKTDDPRPNRIAAMFEILTRPSDPDRPGEQETALAALLRTDPTRELISEAIAYVRDPSSIDEGRRSFHEALDGLDRFVLENRLRHLQWQLDFREKHDQRYTGPKLKELGDRNKYLERELALANTYLKMERARAVAANSESIRPEPEPQPKRGRHFDAWPDPEIHGRLQQLRKRLRFDNAALLKTLIDNEYANPPYKLPSRLKRANRIHHFGCHPDGGTWVKIRALTEKYRFDNTDLVCFLQELHLLGLQQRSEFRREAFDKSLGRPA
jgi:hypothetical protein